MTNLLKILVFSLQTIDGKKDSALPITKAIEKENEDNFAQQASLRTQLFRKVMLKYNILRVRSKISFECFKKKVSVAELFMKAILSTSLRIWNT